MEILTDVGLAEPIYARSTPAENMARVGWFTSLGGEGELDELVREVVGVPAEVGVDVYEHGGFALSRKRRSVHR